MVTKTAINEQVDIELEGLRLMRGDLPEVADQWASMDDGERASCSLDWDQLIGALEVILDPAYRANTMTDGQQIQYRQLLQCLLQALPVLGSISLRPPTGELDP
jgi:hypothetical protein